MIKNKSIARAAAMSTLELAIVAGGTSYLPPDSGPPQPPGNNHQENVNNDPTIDSNNDSSNKQQFTGSFNYGSVGINNNAPVGPTQNVIYNIGPKNADRYLPPKV
jgi:hypothetical protein